MKAIELGHGMSVCERSFERITERDLRRLAELALDYFNGLFDRRPDLKIDQDYLF